MRLAVVILFAFLASGASAFEYYSHLPLAFTWQNKHGYWFACGPVQCLLTGYGSEEEAFGLVQHDRHGPFNHIGTFGRCFVYQGEGTLESWDNSTEKLTGSTMDKRC